jgi:glucuronate isomerase
MRKPNRQELSPYRYFSPDRTIRNLAVDLFEEVEHLPLISPHGHVSPALFCSESGYSGSPVDLLILSDDYITRKLFSLGVPYEKMGFARSDGVMDAADHEAVWQIVCDHASHLAGTTSGVCFDYILQYVFGIDVQLTTENAREIYACLKQKLTLPQYQPEELYKQFHLEVLCTTDPASDRLEWHRKIAATEDPLRILPTFRADGLINLDNVHWREEVDRLAEVSGETIADYRSFIRAVESQRHYFRSMGAVAADCSTLTPYTCELPAREVNQIFQRALQGETTPADVLQFGGKLLMEMARMSLDDGLVLQLHSGSLRNYDTEMYTRFGPDMGCDIPTRTEFTYNLRPLLNAYGKDPRFQLILFSLDEGAYTRELAPLAGFYPSVRLGPPWWYLNNPDGMSRYFDQVMDIAGLEKTAGFIDDSSSLCLIPARHDLWRRVSANWIAGRVARHIIGQTDARFMMEELAIGLAKKAYHL